MKLSEFLHLARKIYDEHGDLEVVVLDAAGQDAPNIEFVSESDEADGKITRVVLCDTATAEELTAIEDVLDELDDEKLLN